MVECLDVVSRIKGVEICWIQADAGAKSQEIF